MIIKNKKGGTLQDLSVELNVNRGRKTLHAEYLGLFEVLPYDAFRWRYTYPVSHLEGSLVTGALRQRGELLATSNDTITTLYHPTPFNTDASTSARSYSFIPSSFTETDPLAARSLKEEGRE